jgi:predicted RNase H-like nuclease (RuvC/YqgF family)
MKVILLTNFILIFTVVIFGLKLTSMLREISANIQCDQHLQSSSSHEIRQLNLNIDSLHEKLHDQEEILSALTTLVRDLKRKLRKIRRKY